MGENRKEADFGGAEFGDANFDGETGAANEASEFFDGFEVKEPSEQSDES